MSEPDFLPLLFGGDLNVVGMARAFHEAYGVRSTCYGKFPSGPAFDNGIIDYRVCRENEEEGAFLRNVAAFAGVHPDKTVLVIGCGDSYIKLCADNRDRLPLGCVAPYADGALIDTLIRKDRFYALCDELGVDHPATVFYRREMGRDFDLPFDPPYICKPADGVAYWAHPFAGNDKVFCCADRAELEAVLDRVYASGYDDAMIIQDFIPGDDSYMRVLTCYSDAQGAVKLMCLGNVLLEEHTPHGIGNHAVILTEENDALCQTIKGFLEQMKFTGFSNFDIKYDRRDGKYKVFEINCRQGRSNYYVTGAGHNLAKILVEDRVQGKTLDLVVARGRSLWSVVPLPVAYRYTPKRYHDEMRALVKAGKFTNTLLYPPAMQGFKRRLRVMKNQLGHYYKFKRFYQKPAEE